MSHNLSFYYYTAKNERYTTEPLVSFNQPSGNVERLDRTKKHRFGNPGSSVIARTPRPISGARTIKDQHHKPKDPLQDIPEVSRF